MRRFGGLVAASVSCLALALFAWPVAAGAAGSVYVIDGAVSQYAIGAGGLLSPLTPASVAAGSSPSGVAVTHDGRSAYVTNVASATVSQYSIDPLTGALSPKTPASVAAGSSPSGVAVTHDGRSAYVVNDPGIQLNGTVSQYSIDPLTGALSPKTPASVPTGRAPQGVAVTPDGKSVYVTNTAASTVSQYSIDQVSGALSPKAPASVVAGSVPLAVAVTPDGKSAYVSNFGGDTLSQYSIDSLSGALSPKTPASVPGGSFPLAVAVTPDGKSAYVTNPCPICHVGGGDVSQYSIDPATGALSPKAPASVATGRDLAGIAVSPDGASAYVSSTILGDGGIVLQYDINPLTGGLSPKTPPSLAAGQFGGGIAVGPLPRVPTSKEQCKKGGWRNYPQFKSQGQCVAFVVKQARQKCLGERAKIGLLTFRTKYGLGPYHVRAMRRCVNQTSR